MYFLDFILVLLVYTFGLVKREKFKLLGTLQYSNNLPASSSNVIPILLSSFCNQPAMSGKWAYLSPVLFSFCRTLCPINSNNSLMQSLIWSGLG